jgi:hypothetical protein
MSLGGDSKGEQPLKNSDIIFFHNIWAKYCDMGSIGEKFVKEPVTGIFIAMG